MLRNTELFNIVANKYDTHQTPFSASTFWLNRTFFVLMLVVDIILSHCFHQINEFFYIWNLTKYLLYKYILLYNTTVKRCSTWCHKFGKTCVAWWHLHYMLFIVVINYVIVAKLIIIIKIVIEHWLYWIPADFH